MKFCGRYQTAYKTDDIKTAFKTVVPPKKPYISRAFGFFTIRHILLPSLLCAKKGKKKPKRKKAKNHNTLYSFFFAYFSSAHFMNYYEICVNT